MRSVVPVSTTPSCFRLGLRDASWRKKEKVYLSEEEKGKEGGEKRKERRTAPDVAVVDIRLCSILRLHLLPRIRSRNRKGAFLKKEKKGRRPLFDSIMAGFQFLPAQLSSRLRPARRRRGRGEDSLKEGGGKKREGGATHPHPDLPPEPFLPQPPYSQSEKDEREEEGG